MIEQTASDFTSTQTVQFLQMSSLFSSSLCRTA